MWRGEGLTLYPANKKGALATTILTVKETRSKTDKEMRYFALPMPPLPHLLEITQENVLSEREKARL